MSQKSDIKNFDLTLCHVFVPKCSNTPITYYSDVLKGLLRKN